MACLSGESGGSGSGSGSAWTMDGLLLSSVDLNLVCADSISPGSCALRCFCSGVNLSLLICASSVWRSASLV